MASQPFTKKLTATDINKRLAIPGKILPSLPAFNGGHAVRIQLMYGTVIWPIDCTVRKNGTEIWPIDCTAVILSVMLLHFTGFFVGYISATICRIFREAELRAISIEVGMQNSSLGVVLATTHFSSPVVALPPAMSAVIMNITGSSLGFFWRQIRGSKQELEDQE